MQKVIVYNYTNYRHYLRDLLNATRESDPTFSFRKFCKRAGIVSPSFLKHVIDGTRNLSSDGAKKFMLGFRIEDPEASFFGLLVLMNQASTVEKRNEYFQRLKKYTGFKQICQLEKDGFEYYHKWYHPAIRELIGLCHSRVTAAWLAKTLKPHISAKAAQESLDLLLRLDLIEKVGDTYSKKHTLVKGFTDLKSLMLQNYHREMIELGKQSLERFLPGQRNVTSVTISVREEQIEEIKNKIAQLREDLLQIAIQSKDPNIVLQVNFQEFPLTEIVKLEKRGEV